LWLRKILFAEGADMTGHEYVAGGPSQAAPSGPSNAVRRNRAVTTLSWYGRSRHYAPPQKNSPFFGPPGFLLPDNDLKKSPLKKDPRIFESLPFFGPLAETLPPCPLTIFHRAVFYSPNFEIRLGAVEGAG
jgi:hypothetical protein